MEIGSKSPFIIKSVKYNKLYVLKEEENSPLNHSNKH